MRSPFCHFCYFCGTLLSHADSFYCPTEIKEIFIPLGAALSALSAISAISAGHYYLMRIVFISRRYKGNIGNLVTLTLRSHFCYFCHFCGTISISCGKFFCPTVIGFAASLVEEIKEIEEILLPSLCAALSAISAISAGHYYLMRIVFISCRYKGNKGNSSFGCCLRSAFGLKTSGEGTSETYMRIFFAKKNATSAT